METAATLRLAITAASTPGLLLRAGEAQDEKGRYTTDYLIGSDYMAARIPDAVSVRVPDAGHGVNIDQPEIVNRALGEFLGGL